MKRLIILPVLCIFILLSFSSRPYAQMEACGAHSKTNDSRQMSMDDAKNMDMMKNMSNQCQLISDKFKNLKYHFQKMMQINDKSELKIEMQKQYEMMGQIQSEILEHAKICQHMMAMMTESDMSQSRPEENNPDHAAHKH